MIGFAAPWLLWGLAGLPILWLILRAVPPAPKRQPFPAIRLLFGLKDEETTPVRTPLWLMLLRMFAVASAIIAFAGPVLNPQSLGKGSGPLLILMDADWASADDWRDRISAAETVLAAAAQERRPVALLQLSHPPDGQPEIRFGEARDLLSKISVLQPEPWPALRQEWTEWFKGVEGAFETIWISNGLGEGQELADQISQFGAVSRITTGGDTLALLPARIVDGKLALGVLRTGRGSGAVPITVYGRAPNGLEAGFGKAAAIFAGNESRAEAVFDLPLELRNRVTRVEIDNRRSAGGIVLAGDSLRRPRVLVWSPRRTEEGPQLVSELFYLRKALEGRAEIVEEELSPGLLSAPNAIILGDSAALPEAEVQQLEEWVQNGGLLLRFAGPQLALGQQNQEPDALLPVPLRGGGRSLDGTLTWETPKQLERFSADSPFAGLPVPEEVVVRQQVVAEPSPELRASVIAQLTDGTPLVTWQKRGQGRVVLFHVTANAEWSDLPLSGLFVQMLERLANVAAPGASETLDLSGREWRLSSAIGPFGEVFPTDALPAVSGDALMREGRTPQTPPGVYQSGETRIAVNLLGEAASLNPMGALRGVDDLTLSSDPPVELKPHFLIAALAALVVDIVATLALSFGLAQLAMWLVALGMIAAGSPHASAQEAEEALIEAATNTTFAYIRTGDPEIDRVSLAGLHGLGTVLAMRTSVEPATPVGIDPGVDELALYPLIYWPVSPDQKVPDEQTNARLNAYMRGGGTLLIDTRDAYLGRSGGETANAPALRRLTWGLEVPVLSEVPKDHVLTRSFYILEDFPGRWRGEPLWVQAPDAVGMVEGAPFRLLNDGVTPVVIGANDFAAAWAIRENGVPMFSISSGIGGERQREMSYRFGVNLVMYVLTGNYKSDQVHIPALLERLGQ